MPIHYNYALNPGKTILPACQVGAIGKDRDYSAYRWTLNINEVTCKRCLGLLGRGGKEKNEKQVLHQR